MKLYATVSGKAQKGQGANDILTTSYTIEQMGERVEVLNVSMLYDKKEGYTVKAWFPKHQSTETILETNEWSNLYSIEERVRADQKGERQKGKRCTVCSAKHSEKTMWCESCKDAK